MSSSSEDLQENLRFEGSRFNSMKLAESAAVLTLGIAGMYCIGWSFVDSYLRRLGIPHDSISFSTDYYLRSGAIPVILVFLAIIISLSKGNQKPLTLRESFATDGHWLILILMLGLLMYLSERALRGLTVVYTVIFCAGILVWIIEKSSFANVWTRASVHKRLFIVLGMFSFMFLLSGFMGFSVARLVLEGKGYGGESKIKLEPKDEKLSYLKDKEYIFIMYRDDLYYLIEPSIPAADEPTVLIVPKDEIKYATAYRRRTP